MLLPPASVAEIPLYLAAPRLYYAATDGVLMALASATLPPLRGSGLALLVTATSLGRLFASILFGTIWTWSDVETAIAVFAIGLMVPIVLAGAALRLTPEASTAE